jgi:tetratricopeptide (TPR) repeat protein
MCCKLGIIGRINYGVIFPIVLACFAILLTSIVSLNLASPHVKNDALTYVTLSQRSRQIIDTYFVGQYVDTIFKQSENSLNTAHRYISQTLDQTIPVTSSYQTYYATFNTVPPNDLTGHSTASVTYVAGNVNSMDQLLSVPYVNISSIHDDVYRAVIKSSDNYFNIFMGFANGLYRVYPYASLSNYPTQSSVCYGTNSPIIGYDPRCRVWYYLASTTDSIQYSPPYLETLSRTIMITSSKRIMYNNQMVGVIGLHFNMNPLNTRILNGATSTKYRFLIDTQGNVVCYPGIDPTQPVKTIFQLEPNIPTSQLNQIINSRSTSPQYMSITKNSESWNAITAYLPNGKYIMVSVYADSLNDQMVTSLFVNITRSIYLSTILITIFTIITVIIGIFVGNYQGRKYTQSIRALSSDLSNIAKWDLGIEIHEKAPVSAEFSAVNEQLRNLLIAVQMGNDAYIKGDLNRALTLYRKAKLLMIQMKNSRGLGVCLNNEASALKQLNQFSESEKIYKESILLLVEQIQATTKNTDKLPLEAALSFRKMNLGVLYKDTKRFQDAEKILIEAMDLARKTDNLFGISQISGNLGQLYMQTNRISLARDLCMQAYQIIKDRYDPLPLQYGLLNLGLVETHDKKYTQALTYFNHILSSQALDPYVKQTCYNNMYQIFTLLGRSVDATHIKQFLTDNVCTQSDILFVLDISGSMGGAYIGTCRQSIDQIITSDLADQDNISMFVFNNQVTKLFENKNKQNDLNEIRHAIYNRTNANGGTAFYDATYLAIEQTIVNTSSDKWVVCLTDGEDNQSRKNPYDIKQLLSVKPVNIIIITVGKLDTRNEIQSILDQANTLGKKGILIELSKNPADISQAFKKTIQLIRGDLHIERL